MHLNSVNFSYGPRKILHNISLTCEKSKTTAIMGPSGGGKTTILKLIAGLIKPDSGNISYPYETPRIGTVFQDFCLLPWMNVFENIQLVLSKHITKKKQLVKEVIDMVGLNKCEKTFPYQLSGGMQQRVGLARALVMRPNVLLLDEPFSALDTYTREVLLNEYQTLSSQWAMTCILVTHNVEDVCALADHLAIISTDPVEVVAILDVPKQTSSSQINNDFKGKVRRLMQLELNNHDTSACGAF